MTKISWRTLVILFKKASINEILVQNWPARTEVTSRRVNVGRSSTEVSTHADACGLSNSVNGAGSNLRCHSIAGSFTCWVWNDRGLTAMYCTYVIFSRSVNGASTVFNVLLVTSVTFTKYEISLRAMLVTSSSVLKRCEEKLWTEKETVGFFSNEFAFFLLFWLDRSTVVSKTWSKKIDTFFIGISFYWM